MAATVTTDISVYDIRSSKSYYEFNRLSILYCQLNVGVVFFLIQRDAYTWAHDHRVHHKYSETDAGEYKTTNRHE